MLSWFRREVRAPHPAVALHLPTHQQIEEWTPPEARVVPADIHVSSLLTMAYDSGLRGHVRSKEMTRLYHECCWMHGYIPLSDQQILCELGARVKKSRPKVQTPQGLRQLTHYALPDNDNRRRLKGSAKSRSRPRRKPRSKDRGLDAAQAA